ncbi:hypothetical protein SISSUDRAFT_1067766 [Sistotremastrum suecicum HHB10207 ss-3]|uniref:C2H2-type domain-containing protein n=1 Tax=Sistotremastrum suecicum HHB10207 ss-3 TaxID=1314776 RepID=A0A165WQH3_9AGAM|nr:hypothetical protein SISSUDRAFT_1067766 [Sistotremastrum suecicum HHB10207 ss-3]
MPPKSQPTEKPPPVIPCPKAGCSRTFWTQKDLDRHSVAMHPGTVTLWWNEAVVTVGAITDYPQHFRCSCGREFKDRSASATDYEALESHAFDEFQTHALRTHMVPPHWVPVDAKAEKLGPLVKEFLSKGFSLYDIYGFSAAPVVRRLLICNKCSVLVFAQSAGRHLTEIERRAEHPLDDKFNNKYSPAMLTDLLLKAGVSKADQNRNYRLNGKIPQLPGLPVLDGFRCDRFLAGGVPCSVAFPKESTMNNHAGDDDHDRKLSAGRRHSPCPCQNLLGGGWKATWVIIPNPGYSAISEPSSLTSESKGEHGSTRGLSASRTRRSSLSRKPNLDPDPIRTLFIRIRTIRTRG